MHVHVLQPISLLLSVKFQTHKLKWSRRNVAELRPRAKESIFTMRTVDLRIIADTPGQPWSLGVNRSSL